MKLTQAFYYFYQKSQHTNSLQNYLLHNSLPINHSSMLSLLNYNSGIGIETTTFYTHTHTHTHTYIYIYNFIFIKFDDL